MENGLNFEAIELSSLQWDLVSGRGNRIVRLM
jgi:hypothetical protein